MHRLICFGILFLTVLSSLNVLAKSKARIDVTIASPRTSSDVQEGWGQGAAVVRQDDGKYIEAGPCALGGVLTTHLCLVRFDSAGQLDPDFGVQGIVYTRIRGEWGTRATSLVVQPDGKILVAGSISNTRNFLIRYQADGSVDTSFGTNGAVTSPMASYFEGIADIALQNDSRIVMTGTRSNGQTTQLFVGRLNYDGSPDVAFGNKGRMYVQYGSTYSTGGRSIGLQSDGKIVVAGNTWFGVVFRFLSNGSLDQSFGNQGKVGITVAGSLELRGMAIRADDKIVLAGTAVMNNRAKIAVAQLEANGSRDMTFDSDGLLLYNTRIGTNLGNSLAVQSDGRIVLAGAEGDNATPRVVVIRFFANGAVDQFFGLRGVQTAPSDFYSDSSSVLVEPNGKIVVSAWSSEDDQYYTRRFTLFRFHEFGFADTTFGENGLVRAAFVLGESRVDGSSN